jgi:recombination protein RecA
MAQTAPSAALLEHLRDQIQKVQAAPRRYLAELKTGLSELDALHALQLGTVVELCGEPASGRTSLALRAVAAAANESRLSAWVDGPVELYPPGAAALGVDLRRLLVVRPKEPGRLVWTACQLARSGAFAAVVADFTHTGVRLSLADAQKLGEAARKGGTLLLILTAPEAPGEGLVKLMVRPTPPPPPVIALGPLPVHPEPVEGCPEEPTGIEVEVTRSRQGAMGRTFSLRRNELLEGRAPPLRRCMRVNRDSEPAKFLESLPGGMVRPKKNLLRDGHGLCATRPGRDGPFQPMNLGPRTMGEARKKKGDSLKSLPNARSFH